MRIHRRRRTDKCPSSLPPSLPPSLKTYLFGVSLHIHLDHHRETIDLAAVGLHKFAVGKLLL